MQEKINEVVYQNALINIQTANEILKKFAQMDKTRELILRLQNCKITDEGIFIIAQALENNSTPIEHFSILGFHDDKSCLSNAGRRAILKALIHNKTLRTLFIGNGFDPVWDHQYLDFLTEFLKKNTSLHHLTILNLKLHDQDHFPLNNEAFITALKNNTTLEDFCFWDTGLNKEDKDKIEACLSRNSALAVFYKTYRIYIKDPEEYNYRFDNVRPFIQKHWRITENSCIITENYKLIELHYFTNLHLCFKNFLTCPEDNLNKIVLFLSAINENPSQQFIRALGYVIREFTTSDLYSQFELKLFLLETTQKMSEVCFNLELARFEISCILGDLQLKHCTIYDRRQCYQRIVDILALQYNNLPSDLKTYLLAAASALETENCEASLNSLSSSQSTVFAWTIDELNTCCEELNINLNQRLSCINFMKEFHEAIITYPLPDTLEETLGSKLYDKLIELKEKLKAGREVKAVFPSSDEDRAEIALEVSNLFREAWGIEIFSHYSCN